MAYWLELHCDAKVRVEKWWTAKGCQTEYADSPGTLTHSTEKHLLAAARKLRKEAKSQGWKLTKDGWTCPACLKNSTLRDNG